MGLSFTSKLTHLLHWSAVIFLTGLVAVMPFASSPGQSAESTLDTRLTLRVRQALLKDPAVGQLNLGVTVRSSTAILWGDVTDGNQARRAEELARQVTGILAVQNELRITPPDDPVRDFVQHNRLPGPTLPRVSMLQRPAGMLTSQPELRASTPASEQGVTLLPPLALTAPPAATARLDDLSSSVEKLTASDPRFRGLRPEIEGGIVRLRGSAGRWEDVMELAQILSRVGGVERVILQDVRTPR